MRYKITRLIAFRFCNLKIHVYLNLKYTCMTVKLTLTIDDAVIAVAKKYARQQGKSLSDIVESYLYLLTSKDKTTTDLSPRILKLKGAIKLPANFDYKMALAESISRKHKK